MSQRLSNVIRCGIAVLMGACAVSGISAQDTKPEQGAAGKDGPGYVLAYKFQPGEVVRYETVQNAKFVSQFQGIVETATNKTETKKTYRVIKVNEDGSANLELVIEWVRMKADFGGGAVPTEFDSKDPAAKSQARFKDVLRNVGKPQARLIVAPNGQVLKVQEMELVTPSPIGVNNVQMKNMTGRDDFNFLTVFPTKPIKVGESWSEESKILVSVEDNLKKPLDARRDYTLKSVDGAIATVAFKTVILNPIKDNNIAIQLIQRETYGKLAFDMEKGVVISRTVESDKSVINPAGNNTAMHSTSHTLERLMTETAAISDIPTNGKN